MTSTPQLSSTTHGPSEMKAQVSSFKQALSSFASSPSNFRILSTITPHTSPPARPIQPASRSEPPAPKPKTIYVLDSSFNPPTKAHLQIALSALTQDTGASPKRLLLLLATKNADKAAKPASFQQRLSLMSIFAHDLTRALPENLPKPLIDIAVTKLPYFADKARVIDEEDCYRDQSEGEGEGGRGGMQQVHCTGFDTLIRIMDPKYYPPACTLEPLEPFLSRHRLRVSYRAGDSWGGREEQDNYLRDLREGRREGEGGKREWADRIMLVDGGANDEGLVVSSTKVREACKVGDEEALGTMLTDGVKEVVLRERLYIED